MLEKTCRDMMDLISLELLFLDFPNMEEEYTYTNYRDKRILDFGKFLKTYILLF